MVDLKINLAADERFFIGKVFKRTLNKEYKVAGRHLYIRRKKRQKGCQDFENILHIALKFCIRMAVIFVR